VTEDLMSLQKMQIVSWIYIAVVTVGSVIVVSWSFGLSVLVGGIISICSFWLSHKDIVKMIDTVTSVPSPEERQAKAQQGQKGYLIKFWLRIIIIGIVLLVLIKSQVVNIFGLILGLSTVVFTITFMSMNVARHYFFSGRR